MTVEMDSTNFEKNQRQLKNVGNKNSGVFDKFNSIIMGLIQKTSETGEMDMDNNFAAKLYEARQDVDSFDINELDSDTKDRLESQLTKNLQLYEYIISQFCSQIIEENEDKIEELQNAIKNNIHEVIDNSQKYFEIIKGIKKTGSSEFDKFQEGVIRNEIMNFFLQNKEHFKDYFKNTHEYKNFDIIKADLEHYQSIGFIDEKYINEIKQVLIDKYLENAFPELQKLINELYEGIETAKTNGEIKKADHEEISRTFSQEIEALRDNLEPGNDLENELIKISDDFEKSLYERIKRFNELYFHIYIKEQIADFSSKADFDEYEAQENFQIWENNILAISEESGEKIVKARENGELEKLAENSNEEESIKAIKNLDKDTIIIEVKKSLKKPYEDLKREILLKNKGKINPVKIKDQMVYFGNESFPVYNRERKKGSWKLDPKIVGSSVVLNIKESATGKNISPDDTKKLRFENGFEISKEEYKELDKILKDLNKSKKDEEKLIKLEEKIREKEELQKELNKLRKENPKDENGQRNDEIKSRIEDIELKLKVIKAEINSEIPHIHKVLQTLNRFSLENYGKAPELSDKIKITPYILDNIAKVVRLAKDQIIRKDGIGILEGEAGVGKNVLIDVFAHYTNRPAFIFPCNKRASKEDLTYQWLINENGTYKLHSKVYEAIKTPGAILVFDEINTLPTEVIKLLNGLFDYRRTLTMPYDNEHKKAESDVIIFGTQNPSHYDGTTKLPQDAVSRSNITYIDYPLLDDAKEGTSFINFDEGLITYANMPYFYKLLDVKGYSKEDIEKINNLKLRKESNQKLSEEDEKKIEKFEKNLITEQEFVESWNNIFNFGREDEVKEYYGDEFVVGIRDIHTLIKMAHYIRDRYRQKREGINKQDPIDTSISQRDLNKMMSLLCSGFSPKEAFIEVYIPTISDVSKRAKLKSDLENYNKNNQQNNN